MNNELTFVDKWVAPYWKAILAFVVPGATLLLNSSLAVTSDGGTMVTGNEWFAAALTCIITSGVVLAVQNVPANSEGEAA